MSDDPASRAHAARLENLKKPRRRRRNNGDLKAGDKLPKMGKARGIIGVRKMVVAAIQQQVEALKNRFLGDEDRMWLLEALKVLSAGEKVAKTPNNAAGAQGKGVDGLGVPLPAVEMKT